MYAQGVIE